MLAFGRSSLSYDFNGNLTSATDTSGTATYTWDARNRLAGISAPGLTASFSYDALGRRSTKTINGTATSFLYDGLNPVQELSGTTPTANLLTGLGIDEVFTRTDSAGTSGLLVDGIGSARALVDNAGAVQTSYTYEPFGNTTTAGTASTNSYQYTGRENDGTGLYYYRARYYNTRLQRFIAEDPIGLRGGINFYAYVLNSPLILVDPNGTIYGQIAGGIIGAGFGAYSAYSNNSNASWSTIAQSAAVGLGAGVLSTLPIPGVSSFSSGVLLGMAGGFLGNVGVQKASCPQREIDWESAGLSTLAGGIGGMAGGAIAGAVSSQGMSIFTELGQELISSSVAGITAGVTDAYAQSQHEQPQPARRKPPEGCN